jgi:hypothetical protein
MIFFDEERRECNNDAARISTGISDTACTSRHLQVL